MFENEHTMSRNILSVTLYFHTASGYISTAGGKSCIQQGHTGLTRSQFQRPDKGRWKKVIRTQSSIAEN